MTDTELTDYFDAILAGTEGHLCVARGVDPYRDDNGKYKHEQWFERTFVWPKERDTAIAYLGQGADSGDMYVTPYLMREPKRAKGSAVSRVLVHADIDQEIDEQAVKDLGGFIVRSGSTGHGHVYIPLAWPVTPEQHEGLCRGVAAKLGGDHKYSDNDLLRPPSTLNYKSQVDGGEPNPVTALWLGTGPVDPRDLAGKVGVDFANPVTNGASSHGHTRADTGSAPVNLDKYPSVRRELERDTKDRSEDTYRIAAACRKAGLTLAETTWVVRTRDDLKERLDERGDDDLLAVWLKLDDAERIVHRIAPPSAPAADGAELLDAVHATLTKYVIFPSEAAAIAVTLWVTATHGLPAWQHATRLIIRSPQKRCGKSRLLDIVSGLCFTPLMSTDASVAAIYRSLGDDNHTTPTLLIDEADALFGTKSKAEQNEDLRSLLNAGFQRDRTVRRCVGPNQTPVDFPTFSMCALAAIKSLPDTIVDRGVVIDLKRRRPGETVDRFRIRRDTPPLFKLRAQLTGWVRDGERLTHLGDVEPEMPHSVEDRQQDAWEPLIAIADAAGGCWPELARAACLDLCGQSDDTDDDIQLLADIEKIFLDVPEAFIPSNQIVRELRDREESPWKDHELTPHKLARLLKPFDVRPRPGPGKTLRGYWRDDLKDAFSRYNRPDRPDRTQQDSEQQ